MRRTPLRALVPYCLAQSSGNNIFHIGLREPGSLDQRGSRRMARIRRLPMWTFSLPGCLGVSLLSTVSAAQTTLPSWSLTLGEPLLGWERTLSRTFA